MISKIAPSLNKYTQRVNIYYQAMDNIKVDPRKVMWAPTKYFYTFVGPIDQKLVRSHFALRPFPKEFKN